MIQPNECAYSETFIRAHERLPGVVAMLYGGWFPTFLPDGRLLVSPRPGPRLWAAACRRLLGQPGDYSRMRALTRFLRRARIDVVLAEYGPTGVSVMDACAAAGVPLVVHFHGFDAYHRPTLQHHGASYPALFQAAAAVVAVSRHMEERLLALGAPRGRLFYSPYGVDLSCFSGGDPAAAGPVFVAVGRFVEKKAPQLDVLAFSEVRKACPDARLIMVGDGPLWGATRHLARALDLAEAVEFPGPRSHAEVADVLRRARALIQHSLVAIDGDCEGTPLAILEAGATGLPVVATRHGGIPDAVLADRTGFLVEEGDVRSMAGCMIRLAKNADLAVRLGAAARRRIADEFSATQATTRLTRILAGAARRGGEA